MDVKSAQLVSAKAKFASFIETEDAGEDKVLILIGAQFFIFRPNGEIEQTVKCYSSKHKTYEHKFFKPHVIRTSPNVKYLLIFDQETKKQCTFQLIDNDHLILEQELPKKDEDSKEFTFRAAT